MRLAVTATIAAALLFTIGACASTPTPTTGAPAPTTDAGGGGTEVSAAPTAAGEGGGGSGGDLDACTNTVEEVSAAFGVKVTEALNTVSVDNASCLYYTDKAAFESAMATVLQRVSLATMVFDAYAADDSAEPVSGIGDRAVWFADNKSFIILKGDKVLSMSASFSGPAGDDEAAVRKILEGLGRLAADRF